jgi:hypothetical protein
MKGCGGLLDDVFVTASLREERVSHHPFGAPDRYSVFTPGHVAIEARGGTVVEEMNNPRRSFAGQVLESPWTQLQLAYFVGTAMWTYLTQPFSLLLPGFRTVEIDPYEESGGTWRRLRVTWPDRLATHSTEQTLYFGQDGLLARHDYDVEITGHAPAAHYVSDYVPVHGISVPTRHRVYIRTPEGKPQSEPLIVSIDISELAFS